MSLIEAQEWLNQRPDSDKPLYAVMVQLEGDGGTDYQVVWGGVYTSSFIKAADWVTYTLSYAIAHSIMAKDRTLKTENREVTRAFIVEKTTYCRVIEEVKADAEES